MAINKWKESPATQEFEARVKNLLKGELKRRGLTYGQLAEKLDAIGVHETERNLNNKISRGGFTAAFLMQCLVAIGSRSIPLDDFENSPPRTQTGGSSPMVPEAHS